MDTKDTIMSILTEVFRQVFDNPSLVLTPETTSDDVEGWDSLSHVNLIMAVEMRFKVTFSSKEAMSFKNVNDLADFIQMKLNTPG
jgi:acyl carrier protein